MADSAAGMLFTVRPASPSPILDNGEQELYILTIFVAPPEGGNGPFVRLNGVSAQVAKIKASLKLDGIEFATPVEAQPDTAGVWSFKQDLPASSGVLAVQLKDDTGTASESAIVHLPPHLAHVPAGHIVNLDADATAFLAGTSDRLIRTRSFGLIASVYVDPFKPIIEAIEASGAAVNVLSVLSHAADVRVEVNTAEYRSALDNLLDGVSAEAATRAPEDKELRRIGDTQIRAPLRTILRSSKMTQAERDRLAKKPQGGIDFDARSGTAYLVLPKLDLRNIAAGRRPAKQIYDASSLLTSALLTLSDRPSRLGVCFDEFFRFRPAGLVRGEPIYSLAMDAGEEVQLKQTSETVRSTTFEEALERESERSLTLSSTWSTDVSAAFNESQTDSSDWNVGGNAGFAGAPKVPLNVGVSGGYSANTAAQNSIGLTVQNAYQLSRQAMARLRAQHKTRMEVQDQTSIGVSSVRSLHNRGAVRPRRLDFFKMYRKEMVTYERHGARLCLRLVVDDPGRIVRQEFELNLDAVDPDNEQHYDTVPPPPAATTKSATLTWRPNQPLNVTPFGVLSHENLQVDLKGGGGSPSIPASYLLVGRPHVKMLSVLYYWKQNWLDTDPDLSYAAEDNGVVETSPEIEVVSHFADYTLNTLTWLTPWISGSPNASGTLRLEYQNHADLVTGGHVTIKELVLEISSQWAPPSDEVDAFEQQRDEIRQQIVSELTAERVLRLRDIAIADYLSEVLARAMREHLSAGDPTSQVDPQEFRAWFATEDAYVENAPYWATPEGVERYNALRARLSGFNLGIPLSDVLVPELTASQAVLYLPIRPGAEEDAVALLGDYSPENITQIVSEFRQYREDNFGSTPQAGSLAAYTDIASPKPITATILGEADWATAWEPPQRKFQVLAHWADYVPTDGVDVHTVLSPTSKADEAILRAVAEDANGLR